jgi:hypothetical protein
MRPSSAAALVLVAALLVVGSPASAQLRAELGLAYVAHTLPGVLDSWSDGPGLSVGAVANSGSDVSLACRVTWRHAAFADYTGLSRCYVPEIVVGESYGEAVDFWTFGLGIRVGSPARSPGYFSIGWGALIVDTGHIAQDCWRSDSPEYVSTHEACESNTTVTEMYAAFGVGLNLPLPLPRPVSVEAELGVFPSSGGTSVRSGVYVLL